ncbi:MAG: iron-sulfur cluster carrier protein ApbC [Proteobacteria bacterium]|nr:iron-sulfur cluster carrier protein ApbC [Pseudomonadota bacterium]
MSQSIPGVRHIIAVASGKGGVGKSTTAMNLAVALSVQGLKVGLLDADVYGPSVPRMMGLENAPPSSADGQTIDPAVAHGVKVMSMGFLVEEDTPMVWRGPMVQSALRQMLFQVKWSPLDVLVLDMPPGTGDTQLSIAQAVPLSGAVIVSTPQDIALLDARKGLNMFRKVNVPILGMVENMSVFICPNCGHEAHIFSHKGAEKAAEELQVPFLGAVPLDLQIREKTDSGKPLVISAPESKPAAIYREMAKKVTDILADNEARAAQPVKIVIE